MTDAHQPSRRPLIDYSRPSVAVDTAVLTVVDQSLSVLLVRAGDDGARWRLPGTFLHEGETLRDAVLRSLRVKAGVAGLQPRQLHVFDAPDRDDRGWVLSVAHVDVVRAETLPASDHIWIAPISDLPDLPYDHRDIVDFAVDVLRSDYRRAPDPGALLDGPFTMRRLRLVHEAVLGEKLVPDTFRRAMTPALRATGRMLVEGRGRPAELFERV
ncbi:NUDIX hydrolase [Microbacterium sp. Sa4CUA7]|uniref:NUDIX hydrolase n=1 Tax=Microbacterium pullorum TaxID=2762236 RepID=A0ABR8RYU7_9MICO|nr:NUDIX domain-containing protein [Microbacterium pullorum]MBD7956402.1 NUDIX hydrolase [Microbacterium pullorum]